MHLSPNHYFLTSAREVRQLCQPLEKISIDYFSYTRSYADGRRIYLHTSPNWLQHYFERDFYAIGNCELKPTSYQTPHIYLWSTLPKQLIYEETRRFGIQDGLFFVNPSKDYIEFYEFSTFQKISNMANIYLNHYELIQSFKLGFALCAEKIIKEAENCNMFLPYNKGKFILPPNKLTIPMPQVRLTQQQRECASRLLEGKSQKVIAKEMGLSPRTVETYLNNLKSKFGVGNKTALIVALTRLDTAFLTK